MLPKQRQHHIVVVRHRAADFVQWDVILDVQAAQVAVAAAAVRMPALAVAAAAHMVVQAAVRMPALAVQMVVRLPVVLPVGRVRAAVPVPVPIHARAVVLALVQRPVQMPVPPVLAHVMDVLVVLMAVVGAPITV